MWLPKAEPHLPPDHDEEVVYAIRAVEQGIANAAQQQTFWRYLMYVTGASEEFNDLSYRPGGSKGRRATDLAEGKRFVGLMIRKLLRPEFTPKPASESPSTMIQERLKSRRTQRTA